MTFRVMMISYMGRNIRRENDVTLNCLVDFQVVSVLVSSSRYFLIVLSPSCQSKYFLSIRVLVVVDVSL